MRVLSRLTLREFWTAHKRAKPPLERWYKVVKLAMWKNFSDVRRTFGPADTYKKGRYTYVIFNIGGNKYRLVAKIDFAVQILFVCTVLTHDEYEDGKWKDRLPS